MHKGMKTIEELKLEVAQTALPEETKELFYKVLDTADVASLSESDRIQYESDLKNYRDTMSCIEFARHKGISDIAARMKVKGISPDVIADCTGPSVEDISKL